MATPTNRFMNVTSVTFTPTGGSATTITGVTSCSVADNADRMSAAGDGDLYETLSVVPKLDPVVTVECNKPALMRSIAAGTIGQLVFTMNDARNLAVTGGGALIYTVSNAQYVPGSFANHHRQWGTNTYTFHTFSSDGTTSPVSIAAA